MIHQAPIFGQGYDPSTEKTFAECARCTYCNTGTCIVKHIDCSVREGKLPCTKYEAIE